MSFSVQTVDALRAARRWARERDEARGYSISYKRIALAFLAEFVVIGTSLYGAWMFSQMYGSGNDTAKHMMMLAPISYALIEFCRVPLALSTRTQRSLVIKALAAIGVVAAMGVTVKSMSQLGEIMFRPRLFEVVKKHELLIDAQNSHASLIKRIEDADAGVEHLSQELTYGEKHLSEATAAVAGLPPPNCQKLWVITRQNRRVQTTKCTVDTRTEAMKKNLEQASATRDAVKVRLGSAQKDRAALKRDEIDRKLSEAQVAHKDAVFHSQLHSFTAMAFAKIPLRSLTARSPGSCAFSCSRLLSSYRLPRHSSRSLRSRRSSRRNRSHRSWRSTRELGPTSSSHSRSRSFAKPRKLPSRPPLLPSERPRGTNPVLN